MRRSAIVKSVVILMVCLMMMLWFRHRCRRPEGFQAPLGTTRFSTTQNPWGVAFSRDGKHLFVGGEQLMVYELQGRAQPKLVRTLTFAKEMGSALGLAVSPNGAVLVAGRDNHVSFFSVPPLVSGKGSSLIGHVPVPKLSKPVSNRPSPIAAEPTFSPDGTRVVCAIEYQKRAMVINVDLALKNKGAEAIIGFIPAGSGPVGVAFFPGTNYVAFTNQSDRTVTKFGPNKSCSGSLRIANWKTGKVESTVPMDPGCDAVRVVVGAKFMYVSSRSADKIVKIDRFNSTKKQEIAVGPSPVGLQLVKGGRLIVAASNRFKPNDPGEINVVDTTTNRVAARIPGLKFPRGVAVSPAGTTAAVTYFKSGAVELVHF
jgi:YVTN family beta-propeller protein